MGANTGSAKTTPASAKNVTNRSGASSARKSGPKHSLFNPAPKIKHTQYPNSDDDEEEKGDTCASSVDSALPTSKTQHGREQASTTESSLTDLEEAILGTPSKTKNRNGKNVSSAQAASAQKPASALGKRAHDRVSYDEAKLNDEAVPFNAYTSFMQQMRHEVKKEDVDGYGKIDVIDLIDDDQASPNKKRGVVSFHDDKSGLLL